MTIRAISFDVGETLLRPYPSFGELFIGCCRRAGLALPSEASVLLGRYADRYFADLRSRGERFSTSEERSRQVWTTLYREFLASHGVPPGMVEPLAGQIYATFLDHASYRLFDDARPVLLECRARGFRIGITSNWEAWLTGLLRSTGLTDLLDFSVISGLVGHEKPDRRIFDAAVAAAGVSAGEILHVGDSFASDVKGAVAAGLQAVLLERHGPGRPVAVRRIDSLNDLLDLPELQGPPARL
jgi:putative hydrolase of the HAD superfamily